MNYYHILNIPKTATQDEVKAAFRKKAHETHPDKQGGNEALFKQANEAYQVLGNPKKRTVYDAKGETAFAGKGFAGTGKTWDDFKKEAAKKQGGTNEPFFDIMDGVMLFGAMDIAGGVIDEVMNLFD